MKDTVFNIAIESVAEALKGNAYYIEIEVDGDSVAMNCKFKLTQKGD